MNLLFVAVQDVETHSWYPVARVTKENNAYTLTYTKGADHVSGFNGFGRMNDLRREYRSDKIFPLLANRSLAGNRPEHERYAGWLGLDSDYDVFDELSRTGGLRATDQVELIPCPKISDDKTLDVHFFARGLRHIPSGAESSLMAGQKLLLLLDIQNPHDKNAILLRTENPPQLMGYVPRYYAADFRHLLTRESAQTVAVTVERVNPDAPAPYRLLCRMIAPWLASFRPCSSRHFQPYVDEGDAI